MTTATVNGKGKTEQVAAPDEQQIAPVTITPLKRELVVVRVVGETPLITHAWSEKARKQMRDKQMGKASQKKAPKDPAQEAEDATYRLDDGRPGFPATAFKAAIVDASRFYDKSVTAVTLKQAIQVEGAGSDQLVPIEGDMKIREDLPRISMGTTDLRYRPEFWPWTVTLHIRFVTAVLTEEAVINLVNAAGIGGVGEWRPSAPKSKTGIYGTFRVAD